MGEAKQGCPGAGDGSDHRATDSPPSLGVAMKFLLMMHMSPAVWESLTEDQRNEVFEGHGDFMKLASESGEMVETKAIAEAGVTKTVRVREGKVEATTGPLVESETFLCGYYLVDVADEERAIELAALIPDAKHTAIEVRPVLYEAKA